MRRATGRALLALLLTPLLAAPPVQAAPAQAVPTAQPVRVTSPGCCTGASWAPDSSALLYIDRPAGARATAVYSAPAGGSTGAGGATPSVRFSRVAFYSPDLKYSVLPGGGVSTAITRLSDGQRFSLPTSGANVLWAPGGAQNAAPQVAYTVSQQSGNYDQRQALVYTATLGGAPRQVASTYGGGATGWVDGSTLLLSGKSSPGTRDRSLYALTLNGGARTTLATALGFRDVQLSPGGRQVVYAVAFDAPGRNGLFLQSTAGGAARKLPFYGSLRWRDATHLLYIPLTPELTAGGPAPHTISEYDTASGKSRPLLNLGAQVLSDQWNVSPDGRRVFFQNARDAALYVAALPQ